MHEKTQERLARIQELVRQKEAIEKELEALLSPAKEVVLPPGFSINAEVLVILNEAGEKGMAKSTILDKLQKKFPNYGINRKRVASALAYLKNQKGQIELLDRGIYKTKTGVDKVQGVG